MRICTAIPGLRLACAVLPARVLAVLLCGLAVSGTVASAALPAQELPLARCYDLHLGPWEGTGLLEGDSLTFAPPSRILIDTVPARRGSVSVGRQLREAPGAVPSVHPFTYWQLNRDSLELVWSTGFAGVSARLPIGRDSLRGTVRTFSDAVHAPQLEARITAVAAECEGEPSIAASAQRSIPVSVRLRAGGRIELGAPIDSVENLQVEADRRSARLEASLARPFADARDIQLVADDDGRIGIVRFRLSGSAAWDAAVRALVTEYGPPSSRSRQQRDDIESETIDWSNRVTTLSMHRSRGAGEPWHASVVIALQRFRP